MYSKKTIKEIIMKNLKNENPKRKITCSTGYWILDVSTHEKRKNTLNELLWKINIHVLSLFQNVYK